MARAGKKLEDILNLIREQLGDKGIILDAVQCSDECLPLKVVCLATDLKDSVRELGQTTRDQVVMVRIDEETSERLDAWVEAGAVKSRSQGAALFIREGLKVRAAELEKLKGALDEVENAKQRLQKKAKEVFGEKD